MSRPTFKEMYTELDRLPMPKSVTITVEMHDGQKESRVCQFGGGWNEMVRRFGGAGTAKNEVPYAASKAVMVILRKLALSRCERVKP